MKIAISCDHVLERNHALAIVEMVGAIYEDAEIFTIVHKPGNVLGPIEQRKIRSTYLSHKVKDKDHFYRCGFLVPSAAKNLHIPCNFDLVINISSGFSQGIQTCKGTKVLTYLLPFEDDERSKKKWWERLFSPYLKEWSQKALNKSDLIWVPDTATKKWVEEAVAESIEVKVVYPFFNIEDFPLIPSNYWKHDFFAVEANGMDCKFAEEVFDLADELGVKAVLVGEDDHLNPLKKLKGEKAFFGSRCTGELAPFLAASRGFISFKEKGFPDLALKTLAVGRPVIVRDTMIHKEYFEGQGVSFIPHLAKDKIKEAFTKVSETHKGLDAKKVRAQAMKFSPQKFKGQLLRTVKEF